MIKTCLACGETMSEDDNSVAYFSFPSDNQILEKWLDFCNLTEKFICDYNNYFICSKHFKTEDLIYQRMDGGYIKLHYHAVPSLFPPTDIKRNLNQIRSIKSVKPNMFSLLDSDEETESPDSPIPEENPTLPNSNNHDDIEEVVLSEATQKRVEKCWELSKETLRQQKRKIKELQQRNRRLSRKVNNLKNIISELDGAHLIDEV